MKKNWWKILGVLLLLYTILAGMLVPLKPGITRINPNRAAAGESVTISINGYNTHFAQGNEGIRAWLKLDDRRSLEANNIFVENDGLMHATFALPQNLPSTDKVIPMSLIVDNSIDGASVLPDAVFISQSQIDSVQGARLMPPRPIDGLNSFEGMTFPYRNILVESIRNMYFHVPLWFGMILIFALAVYYNWRYLQSGDANADLKGLSLIRVGVLYGILGLATGALWARFTWGQYWSWDVKQNMSAVAMLIYLAYFVLRGAMDDREKQARLSAVYSIFAFAALIPLLFVIPRLTDSLHPGNGGNPGFGGDDLDNTMRMVFYPAIIGWTLFGLWIAQLFYRKDRLLEKLYEN
ncbi:MAG: cytochrome c biogenesis protein CcsA [Bacteroidota bacterium]